LSAGHAINAPSILTPFPESVTEARMLQLDATDMAVIYYGMEKDLSIMKEVLAEMVDGVYADALNQAIKNRDKSMGLKSQNIFALRDEVWNAKTEEELKAINEKLKGYYFGKDIILGDK
jgi:hypothetical protein